MPDEKTKYWIERVLNVGSFSCSEEAYVGFRTGKLREFVLEASASFDDGYALLRSAALERLSSSNTRHLDRALSCLYVLGTSEDVPAVEQLVKHSDDQVRKAAQVCLFEIRRRK